MATTKQPSEAKAPATVARAFGQKNRERLIDLYFAEHPTGTAWEHVYGMLLWIDSTTGLAHCYESDKSQPGKNWYGRTLAFHDGLATAFNVEPRALADKIDWLFRRATADLAAAVLARAHRVVVRAAKQRAPYDSREMPEPGEDPELVSIIREVLGEHLTADIPPAVGQELVQRIRKYLSVENKRRNLVGEGFEDVTAAIIRRAPGCSALEVKTRTPLNELPGFNRPRTGDKENRVDLAVLRPNGGKRTLVTAKWSLRADRERQFPSEYAEFLQAESFRQPFDFVFVTNEFDPARLMRACDALAGNSYMFAHVVHISTDAVRAVYQRSLDDTEAARREAASQSKRPRKSTAAAAPKKPKEDPQVSMQKVLGFIDQRRLLSLDQWLEVLAAD